MKHNTMNRSARRLMALLLSLAMLVSVFSATGLSLVFAAGENHASVAFGNGYMITENMRDPEGMDGVATGGTHYHDEGGTSGTAGHTVLGSELGLSGEYADRYALHMDGGNDRLIMYVADGTFTEEVTVTFTYYFPADGGYSNVHHLRLRNNTKGADYKSAYAQDDIGTVVTTTATSIAAADVNNNELWIIFDTSGQDSKGAYLLDVTFTTASTTEPEPEPATDYASISFANDTITTVNGNILHNHPNELDGEADNGIYEVAAGTGIYGIKLSQQNSGFGFQVNNSAGWLNTDKNVKMTVSYYAPGDKVYDNTRIPFQFPNNTEGQPWNIVRVGKDAGAAISGLTKDAQASFTYFLTDEEAAIAAASGSVFVHFYNHNDNAATGGDYIYITEVRIEATDEEPPVPEEPEEPEVPEEPVADHASISFAGDTITTVNGNILHNHPDAADGETDNGIYEVAAGTGIYGTKLSRQNEGFGFGIDNNSGFLSADKNVKLTVTYYAPSNAVQDNTRIPFQFSGKAWNIARVGEDAGATVSPLAKDELSSFTYILTEEEAAAVMANGNVFVHFYNYNDDANTGGDYIYITEVRIEATDEERPEPEEPEEPEVPAIPNYAAVQIGKDFMLTTGMQNPESVDGTNVNTPTGYHNQGEGETATRGSQGNTTSGTKLGLTGDYADRFALGMDSGNDRLMMRIENDLFDAESTVTITVTYYFPETTTNGHFALCKNGTQFGDNMTAAAAGGKVQTYTTTLSAADVNGQEFWVIYWGGMNGLGYVLDVTFTAGEHTLAALDTNDAANGNAYEVQAGNKAAVIAVPNAGYRFEGWYDAENTTLVDNETIYFFTITEDTTLTPRFAKIGNYAAVNIGKDFMVTTGMDYPEIPGGDNSAMHTFYHDEGVNASNTVVGHTVSCPSIGLTDPQYANEYAIKMDTDNDRLMMNIEDGLFAPGTTVKATATYYFPQNDAYNESTNFGFGKRNENVESKYEYLQSAVAVTEQGAVKTLTFEIPAEEVNGSEFWAIYWNDANETTDVYLLDVTFTNGEQTFATLTPETVENGDTLVVQAGNNVGVLAQADTGYQFVGWHAADGAQMSINNPYVYTLTEDSTITPHFTTFILKVNTATDENGENADATKYGTVTSSVEQNAAVVTATPNTGVTFVGWYDEEGNLLSSEREYAFQLTENTTITPRFQFVAGAADLQAALNNAKTWLVGYTPATQEAYRDAVKEVRRLLEVVDNPTAEEVATALKNLAAADAALTKADATTKGYAAIDFRGENVLVYNLSNHSASDKTGHESFDGTHYGQYMAHQNATIWMEPAADIFAPSTPVKVTVHYYYSDSETGKFEDAERLGVQLNGEHLGTFQASGTGNHNNNEKWVYEQEATLTMYLPDSTPLSERNLLQVARWLYNNNEDASGNAKMYIEGIEIEAVDEVPGDLFVHIYPYPGEYAGQATGGNRQKGSVQSFTANPNRGYRFVRWEAVDQPLEFVNGTNANSQTIYLRMPDDVDQMQLDMYFEALESVDVTATSENTDMGTVTGSDTYYEDEQVVLKAIPQDGYAFAGWYVGDTRVSTDATYTLSANDLIENGAPAYTARFQTIVTAPMEFEDLTNAEINLASNQLVLTAGAGETASAVIATDTVFADGNTLNVAGPHAVELTYYLDPYTKGATPNTDEIVTLVVHDASTGADTSFTVQANNGRDTSTDGVTQEAADSKLNKVIVKLPADFDVTADTLTLQYANGTEMHLVGAKMYWTEEPWRYLVFAPEAETITLPITILDYMPNGMLFEANMNEAPYNAFNLNPISVKEYADSLGIEFDNSSLVEDTLFEGHTVYKPFVSQYLVDKMLAPADHNFYSNLISNLNNGNGFAVSGTQDGMDAWAALIEHIQAIRDEGVIGSWDATLQKLQGQNGARMYLKRVEGDATPYVETLYDAAYYMLNTLFISDSAYNKVVPELNALKLQAIGNGYYVFDSGYEAVYDTETGVIQNTTPISPNHTERLEGSTDANEVANQFFPLNDLGYEDRVDMYGLTDRNFCFSLQGHGLFIYRADENQEFLFTGDDDVHLFINGVNVLAMDGLHGREFRQVSLNSIAEKAGLVDGSVYTFDFFFMERHTQRSNMKIYTNIEILPPNMEVEKNAYVDAEYTQAYKSEDECDPFTKVYYEFVLRNDAESGTAIPIKNLQFTDKELGVELNALHDDVVLNPETALTDLIFIVEDSDGDVVVNHNFSKFTAEHPNLSGDQLVAEFKEHMHEVFINGLQVGQTLRIRGIRHVVVENITNVVSVVAEYKDANGEIKYLAGEADQTLTVIPGDHVVTVDYNVPLHILDNRVFGHMERVQGLLSGTAGMVNSIAVKGDANGTYGSLEYIQSEISYLTNNWLQYTLNSEMAGEDSFTVDIESRYIRSGKASVCLAKDAVLNEAPEGGFAPNYNEGEGCVQNMHNAGARADFSVQNPAGYALLTLNYSNGNGSDVHFDLLVNGTEVATNVALPETGGWGAYRDITFVLTFETAGNSVITLRGCGEGFNVRELRLAEAEMADKVYTYEKVITFVPANNIYYENEFVTGNGMMVAGSQGGTWQLDGTNANIGIDYENSTYGQGGNVGFNGSVTYSNGSALKGTGNGQNTKFSFTFTGTGIDIYSRTNKDTGEVRVLLYEKNGDTETLKKARYVDCEFYSGDLYQIPVVGFMDLPYGTYRVEVYVYPKGNEFTGDRDIFYFDGIRVYNPLGGGTVSPSGYSVYAEEGELGATFISLRDTLLGAGAALTGNIQGSVFYDYKTDAEGNKLPGNVCAPADYTTYGPKNEVYLAPGQSIVFTVVGDYTGLQVAAKSANGTSGKMLVDGTEFTVSSTMDMYYRLNKEDNIYTITNTAAEDSGFILSLTKLKILNSNATFSVAETDMALASLMVTEDTIAYADAYLNGDFETAEKIAANAATPAVPATGNESVKLEAALPQQHVEVVIESALGSYTVTEEAVISEVDVAEAELARDALIHSLLKAN